MNEIHGRSRFAPLVFGCQAPDTGHAEILAHYGSPEQKKRFLEPLMNGEIVRNVGVGMESEEHWSHAHICYNDVRVPEDHMLGRPSSAFVIAQTRLGGGRIHHAMRTIAQMRKAFDMLCERALSRTVRGGRLADLQMTQEKIADGPTEVHKVTLAKQILHDHDGHEGLFPSGHLPTLQDQARARFADLLEAEIGNL